MRRAEFCEYVESHNNIQVLVQDDFAEPSLDAVILRNTDTGRHYKVSLEDIENIDLHELDQVLNNRREPQALVTITRIVGYYSQTANWNRSKLGELKDRRKGDYRMAPTEKPVRVGEIMSVHAAG